MPNRVIWIDPSDPPANLPVEVGEAIELRVPETPTSGYRWSLRTDAPGVLQSVDDEFTPDRPAMPGRGGNHSFRILVRARGSAPIHLELSRRGRSGSNIRKRIDLMLDAE